MKRDSIDDLFDQMQKMFNEVQEAGFDLGREALGSRVPVDVQEEDGSIVVRADLPGVTKEDINVKADEDSVEISAESSAEVREENEKYFRRERSRRSFRRTVAWPRKVDPETTTAKYEDGVLEVSAEVAEDEEGKDVEIE
ncbi:MAG: Hsp20/alpha crystallin family protein [Candidatus Nanohaloarchaea archaeon]